MTDGKLVKIKVGHEERLFIRSSDGRSVPAPKDMLVNKQSVPSINSVVMSVNTKRPLSL